MKLLLDFHYSDFWTDPGKQFKPKAWEKMDYPQLKTTIHDYTRDTIARFKQEGAAGYGADRQRDQRRYAVAGGQKLGAGRRRVRSPGGAA
jgi:hypothetical protein